MLGDGGLAICDNKLHMLIRCKKSEAQRCTSIFFDENDGGRSLDRRMRFTIAHEIGHAFLLSLEDGKLRPVIDLSTSTAIREMESLCNRVAEMLLIPSRLLVEQIKTCSEFTPQYFLWLANRFNTSVETLIHRLRHVSFPYRGFVALIEHNEKEHKFRAIAGTPFALEMFASPQRGQSVPKELQVLGNVSKGRILESYVLVPDRRKRGSTGKDCLLRATLLYETPRTVLTTIVIPRVNQFLLPFGASQ